MTIQSEITNEDWHAYAQFNRRRITQAAGNNPNLWFLVIGLGVLLRLIISNAKISIDSLRVFMGSLGMFHLISILTQSQSQRMKPAADGVFLGSCSIRLMTREFKQTHEVARHLIAGKPFAAQKSQKKTFLLSSIASPPSQSLAVHLI